MYISIQGDIDAGMTENFAECFDIESEFHTSGSKSMAQCMEICFWDFTSLKKLFEMILIEDILFEEAHCFLWSAIIDLELEWFG